MNRKMKKRMLATALCGSCFLTACSSSQVANPTQTYMAGKVVDLVKDIPAGTDSASSRTELDAEFLEGLQQFTWGLLSQSTMADLQNGQNVMISPESVALALGMTACGADGETLEEMHQLLAPGLTMEDFNSNVAFMMKGQDDVLKIANSVWFREGVMQAKEEFLQKVKNDYQAGAFMAPFNDKTLKELNAWIDEKTDHQIKKMLDTIDPESMMFLVNAITFDAKWEDPVEDSAITEENFTNAEGKLQTATMMNTEEHVYLKDEHATGFMRYYKRGEGSKNYAIVCLLPEEGLSVDAYLKQLDGKKFQKLLADKSYERVIAKIPEFTYEYSTSMVGPLSDMGLNTALSPTSADFTRMADNAKELQLYIGDVLHKTKIEVNRHGTKAAAVTIVDMKCGSAMEIEPPKEVFLDRPFVYAIIDVDTELPAFVGAVQQMG